MNKKGSVALSVVIIFMAILTGLLAIPIGFNYNNSLSKSLSATQFAAEALTSCVITYNPENNTAEFEDTIYVKNFALSIIKGNIGIKDNNDLSKTFVTEVPTVDAVFYSSVNSGGMNVNYRGKSFNITRPAIIIAVEYKLKPILNESLEPAVITVVRKFEVNTFDYYEIPASQGTGNEILDAIIDSVLETFPP